MRTPHPTKETVSACGCIGVSARLENVVAGMPPRAFVVNFPAPTRSPTNLIPAIELRLREPHSYDVTEQWQSPQS